MHLSTLTLTLLHILPLVLSAPKPAPHALAEAKKHKHPKDPHAPAKPPKLQCELKHNDFCNVSCYNTFKTFVASIYKIDQKREYANGEHIACQPCAPGFAYPNWVCGFVENSQNTTSGGLILRKTLEIDHVGCKGCGQVPLYNGSDGNVGVLKFDLIRNIKWMSGEDDHTGTFGHMTCRGLCAPKDLDPDPIPIVGLNGQMKKPVAGLWDGTASSFSARPEPNEVIQNTHFAEVMQDGGRSG